MDIGIAALQLLSTETCYWATIMFTFPIRVGFCRYEVGVSRRKNHLATSMKNAMAIPFVGVTFHLDPKDAGLAAGETPHGQIQAISRALATVFCCPAVRRYAAAGSAAAPLDLRQAMLRHL
jgi:hypothetical protein